jgi:hypothetical protein
MFVIGDQSNQEQLHVLFTSDQPTPSGGEVPQPSDFEKKKNQPVWKKYYMLHQYRTLRIHGEVY